MDKSKVARFLAHPV